MQTPIWRFKTDTGKAFSRSDKGFEDAFFSWAKALYAKKYKIDKKITII
jgi:hypothetical protein